MKPDDYDTPERLDAAVDKLMDSGDLHRNMPPAPGPWRVTYLNDANEHVEGRSPDDGIDGTDRCYWVTPVDSDQYMCVSGCMSYATACLIAQAPQMAETLEYLRAGLAGIEGRD
jgi:hypothetical protein